MSIRKLYPGHGQPGCQGSCCLRVTGLGVTLGSGTILHDVNLHIHCGEIVALIGPNGAGKSTLFQAILGQIPVSSGSIQFELAGGRPTRPQIGYVPQSPTFDRGDPVSVLDLFVCSISSWPAFLPVRASLEKKIEGCLARVHGESLIHKPIGALSGGELQRVLLAMALEPLPHILILDEPLSGVDIDGELQLMTMLDELRQQYDLSILLSTHDFTSMERFADKAVLLKEAVLKVGTPAEVLSSPEFQSVFHLSFGKEHLS